MGNAAFSCAKSGVGQAPGPTSPATDKNDAPVALWRNEHVVSDRETFPLMLCREEENCRKAAVLFSLRKT